MIRIGRRALAVILGLGLVLGACSDDGDSADAPSTTAAPTASTSPVLTDDPEPSAGWMVLGGEPVALSVTSCVHDEVDGGITTVLRLDAIDGFGGAIDMSRQRTEGGSLQPTVTDVVRYTKGSDVLEAQRVQVGTRVIDLRDPSATDALLDIDGDIVRATGTFGPPGSAAGDPAAVEGSLVARCPA